MKNILIILSLFISSQVFAQWEFGEGKDDFGDPSGQYYAYCTSELSYGFTLITTYQHKVDSLEIKEPFSFSFISNRGYFEYFINTDNSYLMISDDKMQKHKINIVQEGVQGFVTLEDTDKFTNLLKQNKKIKCILYEDGEKQYLFTINCMGFTKAYNNVNAKYKN